MLGATQYLDSSSVLGELLVHLLCNGLPIAGERVGTLPEAGELADSAAQSECDRAWGNPLKHSACDAAGASGSGGDPVGEEEGGGADGVKYVVGGGLGKGTEDQVVPGDACPGPGEAFEGSAQVECEAVGVGGVPEEDEVAEGGAACGRSGG